MKKIKLPLEMANGVMVRTIDELKENWDLTKVVEHFVSGKLVTWLNDRYYSDIAEKIENLPKDDGKKLQQALCKAFDMLCEDVELDVDEIAERKRRKDLLRQYTSDEKILDNVDHVAFDQEELADLLDEGIAEIYLCNNKFIIPLNVSGKKYVGVGDNVIAEIRSKEAVDFNKLGIEFENVKFDAQYEALIAENKAEEEKQRQAEIEREKALRAKKPGDIIKFGHYGGEDIEWIILETQQGRAKILSRYVLEVLRYEDDPDFISWKSQVTWETCSLRRWLNSTFYNEIFNETEKETIILTDIMSEGKIINADGSAFVKVKCKTQDNIFLMDRNELDEFSMNVRVNSNFSIHKKFNWNDSVLLLNEPSEYVRRKLAYELSHADAYDKDKEVTCWLRFAEDGAGGTLCYYGNHTYQDKWYYIDYQHMNNICGVRPTMWVDLSKLE